MEITIKINGRMTVVEVSAEVAEYMDAGRRKAENLSHERRRHWDSREFDEYIVAAEGLLPCQYTPEDLACQQEKAAGRITERTRPIGTIGITLKSGGRHGPLMPIVR